MPLTPLKGLGSLGFGRFGGGILWGRLDLEHDCAGLVVTWVWMGCFGQGFCWVGWI